MLAVTFFLVRRAPLRGVWQARAQEQETFGGWFHSDANSRVFVCVRHALFFLYHSAANFRRIHGSASVCICSAYISSAHTRPVPASWPPIVLLHTHRLFARAALEAPFPVRRRRRLQRTLLSVCVSWPLHLDRVSAGYWWDEQYALRSLEGCFSY